MPCFLRCLPQWLQYLLVTVSGISQDAECMPSCCGVRVRVRLRHNLLHWPVTYVWDNMLTI
jgi:hypothetical protein